MKITSVTVKKIDKENSTEEPKSEQIKQMMIDNLNLVTDSMKKTLPKKQTMITISNSLYKVIFIRYKLTERNLKYYFSKWRIKKEVSPMELLEQQKDVKLKIYDYNKS